MARQEVPAADEKETPTSPKPTKDTGSPLDIMNKVLSRVEQLKDAKRKMVVPDAVAGTSQQIDPIANVQRGVGRGDPTKPSEY
ncbi:hypothetical protein PUN28_006136 [Cardiocondyla obscurior]|uniref:Uncharacterized protein n=1 Tax=Cardiocondyla obscurior TaxID=286306 RepID=A0AAW2G8Y7_9HYME